MEDLLESCKISFLNIEKETHKIYIYVYLPQNIDENITIMHDKYKAIEYSKEKNCKVEIFEKEIKGFYRPLNEFYINGKYYLEISNNKFN
jgi:hypothetical protein